jgi:hypothetical protein
MKPKGQKQYVPVFEKIWCMIVGGLEYLSSSCFLSLFFLGLSIVDRQLHGGL